MTTSQASTNTDIEIHMSKKDMVAYLDLRGIPTRGVKTKKLVKLVTANSSPINETVNPNIKCCGKSC